MRRAVQIRTVQGMPYELADHCSSWAVLTKLRNDVPCDVVRWWRRVNLETSGDVLYVVVFGARQHREELVPVEDDVQRKIT